MCKDFKIWLRSHPVLSEGNAVTIRDFIDISELECIDLGEDNWPGAARREFFPYETTEVWTNGTLFIAINTATGRFFAESGSVCMMGTDNATLIAEQIEMLKG